MPDSLDALNRYLDDLAEARAADQRDVEPGIPETVQRLQQLAAVPAVDAAFVDRLEERLFRSVTRASVDSRQVTPIGTDRLTRVPSRSYRTVSQRRWVPLLIAAAVLLFAAGAAYRSIQWTRDDDRAAIPAPNASSDPGEMGVTFRGDAARTGTMPGLGPRSAPVILWSSPVLAQTTGATSAVGEGLMIATNEFNMVAIDLESGERVWRTTLKGSYSSPLIFDGKVIVGTQGDGVQAFDLATGDLVWTFRTGANATNPEVAADMIESSPVIVNGTLYIGGGFYGGLFALDPNTGALKWRFDSHGEVWASPSVADGVVYFTSQGLRDAFPEDPTPSALYAIDAETGEQIWWFPLGRMDTSFSTPMVSGGMVIFGATHENTSSGTWFAIDAATGTERWQLETEHAIWGRTAGTNGELVFLTEETDTVGNLIRAVEPATGTTVWTVELQDERINGVVNTGDVLFIKDNARDLIALDAATGAELWRLTLGSRGGSPAVVGDRIYFTSGFNAYAVGPANGLAATPEASPDESQE